MFDLKAISENELINETSLGHICDVDAVNEISLGYDDYSLTFLSREQLRIVIDRQKWQMLDLVKKNNALEEEVERLKRPSIVLKTKPIRLPERYVINDKATVLFWKNGDKTVVKLSDGDIYDKRLGFLTAYFQYTSGLSKNKANKYLDSLVEEKKENKKEKSYSRTFEVELSPAGLTINHRKRRSKK